MVLIIPESELVDSLMDHLVKKRIPELFFRAIKMPAYANNGLAAVRSMREIPVELLRSRQAYRNLVETATEESVV